METYIVTLYGENTADTVHVSAAGGHVEHGVLIFSAAGKNVASFAPGSWLYYVKQAK